MNVKKVNEGEILIFEPAGRIDTAAADEFNDVVMDGIREGKGKYIIDCENLEFVASSGLRVFLVAQKTVKAGGGRLIICNLNGNIPDIFEIVGFDRIFDIRTDRAEALKAL